jgi:peptidoglycan hydrolase CwlO-like protein
MDWKKISVIVGLVITLSGVVYKTVTFGNKQVTKIETNTSEITTLDTRMDVQDLRDQLYELRRDRNFLREQLRQYPNDQRIKDELEEVEEDIANLKEEIRKAK